jgi:hypothetical protein
MSDIKRVNEAKMAEVIKTMSSFKALYTEFSQLYKLLTPEEQLLTGNLVFAQSCPWDKNINISAFVGSPIICEALMGGISQLMRQQPQRNPMDQPLISPAGRGLPN